MPKTGHILSSLFYLCFTDYPVYLVCVCVTSEAETPPERVPSPLPHLPPFLSPHPPSGGGREYCDLPAPLWQGHVLAWTMASSTVSTAAVGASRPPAAPPRAPASGALPSLSLAPRPSALRGLGGWGEKPVLQLCVRGSIALGAASRVPLVPWLLVCVFPCCWPPFKPASSKRGPGSPRPWEAPPGSHAGISQARIRHCHLSVLRHLWPAACLSHSVHLSEPRPASD